MRSILLALFATASYAQDFAIPLIGNVFDPELASIRQILGTPGAARVTKPIPLQTPLTKAVVNGSRALAAIPDQGLSSLRLDAETHVTGIAESLPAFDVAALSPSAATAVVYQKDCACIQKLTGLLDEPRVAGTVSLDGDVKALAINDDATLVAASTDAGVRLLRDGEWQEIQGAPSPSLAFSPNSERLAWIDQTHSEIRMLHLPSGEVSVLAPEGDAWIEPQAVGFVSSTRVAVGTRLGVVSLRDLESQETKTLECACRPEVFERLTAPGMFRMTGTRTGAVWVLAIDDSDTRTFFVPVDAEDHQ